MIFRVGPAEFDRTVIKCLGGINPVPGRRSGHNRRGGIGGGGDGVADSIRSPVNCRSRVRYHVPVVSAEREVVGGARIDVVDDRFLRITHTLDRRHALDIVGQRSEVSGDDRSRPHAHVILVGRAVDAGVVADGGPGQLDRARHRPGDCRQGDVARCGGICVPVRGKRRTGVASDVGAGGRRAAPETGGVWRPADDLLHRGAEFKIRRAVISAISSADIGRQDSIGTTVSVAGVTVVTGTVLLGNIGCAG